MGMDASTTISNTPNNTLVNTTTTNMPQSQGSQPKMTESGSETASNEPVIDENSIPQTAEQNSMIVTRQTVLETVENDNKGVTLRRQASVDDSNKSPVKEKLQKMRRSITEPLMQYFHDMTMTSPDTEEPDVLNTPKSVLVSQEEGERRLSRRLFSNSSTTSAQDGPVKRHAARTSQIHE